MAKEAKPMREIICLGCGTHWHSAAITDKPCSDCGGKVVPVAAIDDGEIRGIPVDALCGEVDWERRTVDLIEAEGEE